MVRILAILAGSLLLINGCSNGASVNNDNAEEVGCNQVLDQTWVVSSASCNGTAITAPYAAFNFQANGDITYTFGGPDCQKSFTTNVNHTVPAITLVGYGNYSCTQAGSGVSSCSGTDTSCNASFSAENITNFYSVCVLRNFSDIRLSRTVAIEDINNGVSLCSTAGQLEEITLSPEPTGTAILSISDGATYDFGSTNAGTPVTKTFTISNSGDTAATAVAASGISTPYLFLGGAFPGTGGTCGTSVAASSACTMVVEFNPSGNGTFDDTIVIAYHNGEQITSTTRAVTGVGVAPPAAILTISGMDPIDFGIVVAGMTSAPTIVTISNTGDANATTMVETGVAAPFQYVGGTYPGTGGDCAGTLAPAATCNIEIEFAPVINGPASGSIAVEYNDGNTMQTSIRLLSGIGL